MCGRYAATATTAELVAEYDIAFVRDGAPAPNHNVAPTDPVPAVVERVRGDGPDQRVVRMLVELRWGLVPSWSADARGAARMINARSETVASKPAFRKAFATRRCLLPARGYYEWTPSPDPAGGRTRKQPYFITPDDGGLLTMAGLYEFWRAPAGEWLATCAIITTTATDRLGHIHDRMPMVITPGNRAAWLDPGHTDPDAAHALLRVEDRLGAVPVSTKVNLVANKGPELIEPLGHRQ